MADELTHRQQRELEAIDRALSGRPVDPDLEDLAALTNELHEMRSTPDPGYAAALDRKAARWLGAGEPQRRRRPSWRVLAPVAAAAAALVIAVVVVGGGDEGDGGDFEIIAVAVEPTETPRGAPLPEVQLQQDSAASGGGESSGGGASGGRESSRGESGGGDGSGSLRLLRQQVEAGQTLVVEYTAPPRARAEVRLGDEEATTTVRPGPGQLRIPTDGFEPGTYELEVAVGPDRLAQQVEIR